MTYKDPDDPRRKVASQKYYLKNKEAQLVRNREARAQHVAYIEALKQSPCTDCGTSFPPYIMEFDHCRGVKRFNIATSKSAGWPQLLEEIAKCDLVCANCHSARTHWRRVASGKRLVSKTD